MFRHQYMNLITDAANNREGCTGQAILESDESHCTSINWQHRSQLWFFSRASNFPVSYLSSLLFIHAAMEHRHIKCWMHTCLRVYCEFVNKILIFVSRGVIIFFLFVKPVNFFILPWHYYIKFPTVNYTKYGAFCHVLSRPLL